VVEQLSCPGARELADLGVFRQQLDGRRMMRFPGLLDRGEAVLINVVEIGPVAEQQFDGRILPVARRDAEVFLPPTTGGAILADNPAVIEQQLDLCKVSSPSSEEVVGPVRIGAGIQQHL